MTQILPEVPLAQSQDDEVHHYTCCRDDDPGNVALCGTDVSGRPWVTCPITCVVCLDLDEHTDLCPVWGICEEYEEE